MSDEPTPRTDANEKKTYRGFGLSFLCEADFARELERENVRLREEIAALKADGEEWLPISTAPTGGGLIEGRRGDLIRLTCWGKTSHVPLYGWIWGNDVEDLDLWEPTHWRPISVDLSTTTPQCATKTGGRG